MYSQPDLITEHLTEVHSTVASYLEHGKYIIQITLGNTTPRVDDVDLIKLFTCNDEEELQQALGIVMHERNFLRERKMQ